MLIRSEFGIEFDLPHPVAIIGLLRLHPSLDPLVRSPEILKAEHVQGEVAAEIATDEYVDSFGNRCTRFFAPAGRLRLTGQSLVEAEAVSDPIATAAAQHPVESLPAETLQFLLSSRYCEVDSLSLVAADLFGHTSPGWARAIWIRDWVHDHVRFDYASARSNKTALDVFTERGWRLPGLPASGHHHVARDEHSRTLCYGLPG